MNAQIRTLKADIAAGMAGVAEIYTALHRYPDPATSEDHLISVAYLHNLYCAFGSIFHRIAEVFENHLSERSGWHAGLLHRMTLAIEDVRPTVLGPASYDSLDELRRFRHLFRSAYRMHLDTERLALVRKKAHVLEQVYRADMERFLAFLDSLDQNVTA